LWRTVVCTYCAAEVVRSESVVQASRFREAYERSRADLGSSLPTIECGGQHYRTLRRLATGTSANVVLAERVGALPARAVLKIAHAGAAPGRLRREMEVLGQLQADTSPGAAYFTQRLPQPVACGVTGDASGTARELLVLRNPTGFWGSLADVRSNHPGGIDPRHAVWMWRRTLAVLAHVHARGWVHGNLAPSHLLVHPGDHGVQIIGWAGARQYQHGELAHTHAAGRDLMQTAWSMRAMLSASPWDTEPTIAASTPRPLAAVLSRACDDLAWCAATGAAALDEELVRAAHEAFGPPKFIPFNPAA
jgi:serine/threonine protein kinase